LSGSMTPNSLP